MPLSLSRYLTAENVGAVAVRYGFVDRSSVEKFMMDFEVYRHVSGSLGCIVRGGMCMPFHLPDAAKRLSIDIDLMTPGTLDDVRDAMVGIDAMDELACKEYHPSNPYPLDNLITYKVSYDSS